MTNPLPKERLDELVALADAATPGPWRFQEPDGLYDFYYVDPVERHERRGVTHFGKSDRSDAEFIAAADPDTVRALIAQARRAQEAEAKLEQVRAWRDDPRNRTTGRIGELDTILDQTKEGE